MIEVRSTPNPASESVNAFASAEPVERLSAAVPWSLKASNAARGMVLTVSGPTSPAV